MQFIPPQVLNRSLLNNSLNASRRSITPSVSEPAEEEVVKKEEEEVVVDNTEVADPWGLNVEGSTWDKKAVEFVLEDSDSDSEAEDVIYQDMQLFLHAINEPQLIDLFLKNKVSLGQLLEFDEQDLINCGVELVGDRKKILANTGQMHCEKWMPSSLQDLTTKSLLSSPGIYIALNDINKHIEYIGVTLKYLKRRIQSKPEILELGKDFVGVVKVSSELDDLIVTIKSTHNQALSLKNTISKHKSNPLLRPANHIDERYIKVAKLKRRFLAPVMVVVAICMSLKMTKKFIF